MLEETNKNAFSCRFIPLNSSEETFTVNTNVVMRIWRNVHIALCYLTRYCSASTNNFEPIDLHFYEHNFVFLVEKLSSSHTAKYNIALN
jgi:hypothetical protein